MSDLPVLQDGHRIRRGSIDAVWDQERRAWRLEFTPALISGSLVRDIAPKNLEYITLGVRRDDIRDIHRLIIEAENSHEIK